jgi:VPDSG-CTERM motif
MEEPRKEHSGNMKLIKTLMAGLAAMVVAAGFALSAQATPITGILNIAGTANFNTSSLTTAGSATFTDVIVLGGNSGTFAGFAVGTPVVMASYTFDPSTITNGLWSVNGFTFNLISSTVTDRTATSLSVSGTGIITGPAGFDATPGMWAFTSQNAGGRPHDTFSFSANTEAVPDSGMTLALLGVGLMGLAAFRAKFGKV